MARTGRLSTKAENGLILDYGVWLVKARGLAPVSVRSYLYRVRRHARVLRTRGTNLGAASLTELTGSMPEGCGKHHHNVERQALISFFDFLTERGVRKDNPARQLVRLRPPSGLPRPFSRPEQDAYLAAAKRLGHRHYVLACLGVYAGLRLGEACRLEWGDIWDGKLRLVGKGAKAASVPLSPILAVALRDWQRECPSPKWVLPAKEGSNYKCWPQHQGHVNSVAALNWHHQTLTEAELLRLGRGLNGFHRTRHTAGTRAYQASGRDLLATARFMRHSNPKTTAIYALVEDEDVTALVQRM